MGFTQTGVKARSMASFMMKLCGGKSVARGSLVAVLQGVGAAGLGPVATLVIAVTGGIAGMAGSAALFERFNV